ncbi:MAG: Holliday junction resolvase-like protein [Dehalococcoidales bacterium]|jgi:predicted Holliday junction resolvase-like endonuclease
MDSPLFIAAVVLLAVATVCFAYVILRWRFSKRFQEWQALERQTLEMEREKIRKSAITQSRSVLGGKFAEQIAPYLPDFKYDPTEARFIGTPFDLIIFPGLACGDPREIVIMEIKTGKNCQLSPVERKIRQIIEDGMVRYEFFQPQVNGTQEDCL